MPPTQSVKIRKLRRKSPGVGGNLLVGERIGLGRDRLLSDLVESGKHTAGSKADRKQKTHRQDSQAGEENCAGGYGVSQRARSRACVIT